MLICTRGILLPSPVPEETRLEGRKEGRNEASGALFALAVTGLNGPRQRPVEILKCFVVLGAGLLLGLCWALPAQAWLARGFSGYADECFSQRLLLQCGWAWQGSSV